MREGGGGITLPYSVDPCWPLALLALTLFLVELTVLLALEGSNTTILVNLVD